MEKLLSIAVFVLVALPSTSAFAKRYVEIGKGSMGTLTLKVTEFSAIKLNGAMDVEYTASSKTSATVSGHANLLKLVKARVEQDTLILENSGHYAGALKVVLTGPALHGVTINGSGDVTATGVDGKALDIKISGSGDVKIDGEVDALAVHINGSGDANLAKLKATQAAVQINGSGDVTLKQGTPVTKKVNGSGDVKLR